MDWPVDLTIGASLGFHSRQKPPLDPNPQPAVEVIGHRVPQAIKFGQALLGGPAAQNPENAIYDAAMTSGQPVFDFHEGSSGCSSFLMN